MVMKSQENSIGAWAFLIGVVLALVIGLSATVFSISEIVKYNTQIYAVLVLLGIVIGFVGVSGKDAQQFLWAGAVLVIVSRFGMDGVRGTLIGVNVGDTVSSIFGAFLALFVPATIVVALKTVFSIAKV